MRHVTAESLDRLEAMLVELRKLDGLRERKRGVFYRRSRAFLHFHEDGPGLFADLRLEGNDFDRFDVSSRQQQRALVRKIREAIAAQRSGTGSSS